MPNSDNCKIYVFHYKNGESFPNSPGYTHILAGKENYSGRSNLTGDDTGQNISAKNKFYSELTGIYWIFKNHSSQIIGTSHYRRFFTVKGEPPLYKLKRFIYYLAGMHRGRHGLIYTSDYKFWEKRILTCEEATLLLNDFDAIMPERRKLRQTIERQYVKYHDIADLQLLRKIITEIAPEYTGSFENTLQQKRLYANNMMVMKSADFKALCSWLFMILFEFERRVNITDYKDYQQRIFGFISERLITAWVYHHNLKVKELPLIYFKNFKKQL